MAATIGRNDPCPCGSAKKYKRCCLPMESAAQSISSLLATTREMDERLVHQIAGFARRRFGSLWLHAAQEEFYADGTADDPSHLQMLGPWSFYHFPVEGRPVSQWFLDLHQLELSHLEREWMTAQQAAWISAWEVIRVDPGKTLEVRDLLSRETRLVHDVRASKSSAARDVALARIVDFRGVSTFHGVYPLALPPREAETVVVAARLRAARTGKLPIELIRSPGFDLVLIHAWQHAIRAMLDRPLPEVSNTDGDPLLLTTDTFNFPTEARKEICRLLEEMRQVTPPHISGRSDYTFLKTGNRRHSSWEKTIIGSATVSANRLKVETNSTKRANSLRRRIERALGGLVAFSRRVQTEPREMMRAKGAGPEPAERPPSPEEAEILRAYKARHYGAWPDEPLPAFAGLTPREAANSPDTRGQLDLMLRDFEHHEARLPEAQRFDFATLRKELGLTSDGRKARKPSRRPSTQSVE